jgi:hypothetical protein
MRMRRRLWDRVADQEFAAMDQSEQDDWAELRAVVNRLHLR